MRKFSVCLSSLLCTFTSNIPHSVHLGPSNMCRKDLYKWVQPYLSISGTHIWNQSHSKSLSLCISCWQNVILILLWPIFTLIICETHKNPKNKKEWNHVFYIVINMLVAPTLIGSNFKKVAPLILKETCRFVAVLSIDVLWFEIQRWPYKVGFITLVLR